MPNLCLWVPVSWFPQLCGGDGALNTSVGSADRASAGSSTARAIKTHMAALLPFKTRGREEVLQNPCLKSGGGYLLACRLGDPLPGKPSLEIQNFCELVAITNRIQVPREALTRKPS